MLLIGFFPIDKKGTACRLQALHVELPKEGKFRWTFEQGHLHFGHGVPGRLGCQNTPSERFPVTYRVIVILAPGDVPTQHRGDMHEDPIQALGNGKGYHRV